MILDLELHCAWAIDIGHEDPKNQSTASRKHGGRRVSTPGICRGESMTHGSFTPATDKRPVALLTHSRHRAPQQFALQRSGGRSLALHKCSRKSRGLVSFSAAVHPRAWRRFGKGSESWATWKGKRSY